VATNPHILTTYVIGLKVKGMSRDELLRYVGTDHGDSGTAPHPEKSVGLPSNDYVMVGGGFKVDYGGSGNMATASFPSAPTTWKARSKDHLEADPANLTTYVIGIKRFLPVGEVLGYVTHSEGAQTPHPRATATVPNGYVLTGGGGDIDYNGSGNMLWSLQPTTDRNQYFTAAGKDHLVPDPATITAYALSIRIQ
jgi:hypothetical protein